MNKDEAREALNKGKIIRHDLFTSNEHIKLYENGWYQYEDGHIVKASEFWEIRQNVKWEFGWLVVSVKEMNNKELLICNGTTDVIFGVIDNNNQIELSLASISSHSNWNNTYWLSIQEAKDIVEHLTKQIKLKMKYKEEYHAYQPKQKLIEGDEG